MLKKFIRLVGGDPNKREIEKLSEIVDQVNGLEPQYESLSNDELRAKTIDFRLQLSNQTESIEEIEEKRKAEQNVLDRDFT